MSYSSEWAANFTTNNRISLQFRPEKASDTELLWKMFSTLSESTVSNLIPPFTHERVESWTKSIDYDKVLAIVAVTQAALETRIVGVSSLKFYTEEVFKHKAELGITMHDDYQNLGIGTALLYHVLSIARKKQLTKITLTVNVENVRAINMYKKAQFIVEGTLHREMHLKGKYFDEYRMALFL